MKYALRTVVWRFKETSETLPELKALKNVAIRRPEDVFNAFRSLIADRVNERFVTLSKKHGHLL
jgi:hypothetical protein